MKSSEMTPRERAGKVIDAWTSHMMFRGVERIGAAEMIRDIESAIEAAVEDERQAYAAREVGQGDMGAFFAPGARDDQGCDISEVGR